MDSAEWPLAITLLRAYMFRQAPVFGRWEAYPGMERTQCLGEWEWSYAIYPHSGDWQNGVYEQAEDVNLPLEAAQAGAHAGTLPKSLSFLEILDAPMQLTAFKRAEDQENAFVVRMFNPTEEAVAGKLSFFKNVKSSWLTDLNEEKQSELKVEGNVIPFIAAKKKIVTVLVKLGG